MKNLVLRVTGESQRDLYHALQKATEMADEEFTSASGTAPGFSFCMSIDDIDGRREDYIENYCEK
jgi:hypothetical protein